MESLPWDWGSGHFYSGDSHYTIFIISRRALLTIMWFMLILSMICFIQSNTLKIIVIIVGIIGTLVMGFRVSTAHRRATDSESLIKKDNL